MTRVLFGVVLWFVLFSGGVAYSQSFQPLGPGIKISKSSNTWRAEIDLCAPGLLVRATPSSQRGQTSIARRRQTGDHVLVNGDFYVGAAKTPVGLAVADGKHWSGTADTAGHSGIFLGRNRIEVDAGPRVLGFDPAWMKEVVGGHPAVLQGGKVQSHTIGQCTGSNRHTAVGFSEDRTKMYLVVSKNITCNDLGSVLKGMGAEYGLNLDGGGSSDMATTGGAIIASTRAVSNHLGVKGEGEGVPSTCVRRQVPEPEGHVLRQIANPDSYHAWGFGSRAVLPASDALVDSFARGERWPLQPEVVSTEGKILMKDTGGVPRHVRSPQSLQYWKLANLPRSAAQGEEGEPLPTMPILVRHSNGSIYVVDVAPAVAADAAVADSAVVDAGFDASVVDAGMSQHMTHDDAALTVDASSGLSDASIIRRAGAGTATGLEGGCRAGGARRTATHHALFLLVLVSVARRRGGSR